MQVRLRAQHILFKLSLSEVTDAQRSGIDWANGVYAFEKIKIGIGQQVPSPRFSHCAAAFNERLFIFGGERKGRKLSNTMFSFDLVSGSWQRELQSAGALSMAPAAGKDYKMFLLETTATPGIVHLALLGTRLSTIYIVVVDTSSGTPISCESINASGQIPGALVGPALDASANAVHRQFDATLISRKSAEDECSQTSDGEKVSTGF